MIRELRKIKLSEVLTHRKEYITIEDGIEYKRCRVQVNRKGVVLRDIVKGLEINTKKQQVCRNGDFLVAEIDAKVGGYGFVPTELEGAIVSSHYFLFEIDKKKMLPDYLRVIIKTNIIQDQINAKGSTNYSAIRPKNVLDFEIPFVDIDEQKLIIDKVLTSEENYFSITAELTTQQSLITQLRQSILQEAVQGKLSGPGLVGLKDSGIKNNGKEKSHPTNPKNSSPGNAAELLKRIKAEKEKLIKEGKLKKEKPLPPITDAEIPYALPEGWVWCRLGEIVLKMEYGTSEKSSVNNDIPVLGMGNIQEGKLNFDKLKYVSKNIKDLPKLYLKKYDLVFNRTNSFDLVGKSAIYLEEDNEYTLASYLIRVAFPLKSMSVEYIVNYINSSICRRTQIEPQITQQTGQANFSGGKLKEILFPLPPFSEQNRIVKKVNQLMQHCNELEHQVQQSINHAQQLMQAVLREVFERKKEAKVRKYKKSEVVSLAAE